MITDVQVSFDAGDTGGYWSLEDVLVVGVGVGMGKAAVVVVVGGVGSASVFVVALLLPCSARWSF